MTAFEKGNLAGLEPLCVETALNAGAEPDGGARGYAILSIAISLKRLADIAESGARGFWNYGAPPPPPPPPPAPCPRLNAAGHDATTCWHCAEIPF